MVPEGNKKSSTRDLGNSGEMLAAEHLRQMGYEIVSKNYRVGRLGEIDLVAREGGVLCFVEVKTRRGDYFGTPSEAVTWRKREKLLRLAEAYLGSHGVRDADCRFDIVEVRKKEGEGIEINVIRNAFGRNIL